MQGSGDANLNLESRGPASTESAFIRGDVTVRARLPLGWKVRNYVLNHHYVELEGPDGQVIRLDAKSLVQGTCKVCTATFYTETRMGDMKCPHCSGEVVWVWGKARLAFLAESDSTFEGGKSNG